MNRFMFVSLIKWSLVALLKCGYHAQYDKSFPYLEVFFEVCRINMLDYI
jgi:hypothetical protein